MFFNEDFHPGRAHFHASYGEHHAAFDIVDLNRLAGKLPPRVERMVRKWARAQRADLLANWDRARSEGALKPIDPLK